MTMSIFWWVKSGMIIPMETLNSLAATPCVPEMFGNMTIQEIHYFIDNFEGEAWGGCKNKKEKIEVAIQVFWSWATQALAAYIGLASAEHAMCISCLWQIHGRKLSS